MKKLHLHEPFTISNKNSEFINTVFSGSNLEVLHSEIKFIGCKFTGFDDFIASFENSRCRFFNCSFEKNGYENSFVSLLLAENSSVIFENCKFKDNRAPLIEARGSIVILKEVEMKNNSGYVIYSTNGEIRVEKSKLLNNGSEEFSSNHLIMESSKGEFSDTTIEGCESGAGIFVRADSRLKLNRCVIKSNSGGIYLEDNSTAEFKNSSIEENTLGSENPIQLFLDSSSANLEQTNITNGLCGVYCQKGSFLNMNRCTIANNQKGICTFEFSELHLKESTIKNNLKPPQIYCEESKVTLEKCRLEAKSGLLVNIVKPISVRIENTTLDRARIKVDR